MRGGWIVGSAAAIAAAAPLVPQAENTPAPAVTWPDRYEGRALQRIAPTPLDRRLAADFPGQIARFSDGRRQVVLRHVASATRQLHPARDCFAAIGRRIDPAPMTRAPDGALLSCFDATRGGTTLRVCERVIARDGTSYPDVSSWYWAALLGRSAGPWLAATTVEQIR